MKPFFKVLWFSALVQAAVVNLFVLNLRCFIFVCPCIPSLTSLRLRVVSHTKERIYYHLPEKKKEERKTKEKGEEKRKEKGERRKEKEVPDRGNTKQPFGETILRK